MMLFQEFWQEMSGKTFHATDATLSQGSYIYAWANFCKDIKAVWKPYLESSSCNSAKFTLQ